MSGFNHITIIGHLGRDPVLRYTGSGQAVADFSIATTEKRGGEETTTWFKVTCWGKTAELANQYLKKGDVAYVVGPLRQTEYTGRDGNKRTNLEVTADTLKFINTKSEAPTEQAVNDGEFPSKPQPRPMPSNPLAKSVSELATPQQIVMIRAICRDLNIDADVELQETVSLDCKVEELSRRAASSFIDHLKQLHEGSAPIPRKHAAAAMQAQARQAPIHDIDESSIPF